MKICYVTSHPIQYQAPLFRALAATPNVQFEAVFCRDPASDEQVDPGFGMVVEWDVPLLDGYAHTFLSGQVPGPAGSALASLKTSVVKHLRDARPDCVIVHGYNLPTYQLAIVAARALEIPVLLRGDTHLLNPRPGWKLAAKRLASQAVRRLVAGALAVGTLNARYWEHYGIPRSRIFMAPYSVDNAAFLARRPAAEERAAAWREELGIAHDAPVALYAGKLIPLKSVDTLIAAFAQAAVPGSALVVVGDGEERARLEAQAASHSEVEVRFVGFVNQSGMAAAYALGDLFVLPSTRDAWGLAVNEAMVMGSAVCVSDQVGCAPDLVGRDNGWTFPARNVDALTEVLREALGDRTRLERMGRASERRVADWDIDATVAGILRGAHAVAV